jgi:hypothetical protein
MAAEHSPSSSILGDFSWRWRQLSATISKERFWNLNGQLLQGPSREEGSYEKVLLVISLCVFFLCDVF